MPRGKAKGSEFERKIAKEIVKAFKQFGITQKDCWRSTMSGGHARSAGDLELSERLEKLFPFCLEMKHRKQIRYENFLLEKDSEEMRWVKQTLDGAAKTDDMVPVLVMRANNRPIYALVGRCRFPGDESTVVSIDGMMWHLCLWKQFLRWTVSRAKRQK